MKRVHSDSRSKGRSRRNSRRNGRGFGSWFVNLPVVRNRVPPRYRPTLFLESLYNVGGGSFLCLFFLATVVLKTILDGTENHLAALAMCFGGSSLLSPLVSWLGRRIPMKSMIVVPNLVVALLLLTTVSPAGGATLFTAIVGLAFILRVFPRVGEMNMFRVNYPATHRGAAVGWVKAIAAVAALTITLLGYWWFTWQPDYYWALFWLVAALMIASALCYARIPVSRQNVFARNDETAPHRAFLRGMKVFLSDRRFLVFQLGFALAGAANHMALVYVAEVLKEDVIAPRSVQSLIPAALHGLVLETWRLDQQRVATLVVGLAFAVLPMICTMASSPLWGRFLDRINPMLGRALFNTFQLVAYGFHAYGGMTLQVWPFLVGAAIHAVGNGGGMVNWLTGSLYFARKEHISLYNAVHVGLTGLRGLLAPLLGLYLISSGTFHLGLLELEGRGLGANLFWVASALSLAGALVMLAQGLTDPGPRE